MRIDHCKYVIAVAESCNIRQTAERFFITQQGLSQAIKAVERELHAQLFTRTGNSLFPTEEAKLILPRLRKIVAEYDQMVESLAVFSDPEADSREPVTVYVTPAVSNSILARIISTVGHMTPAPQMRIIEDLPLDITDEPGNFPGDSIGIITIPEFLLQQSENIRSGKIVFEEYARCPLMAYVAQSSPLAALPCITKEILKTAPLAIFPSEVNMVRHILDDETAEPNVLVNSSNVALFRNLISRDQAIGFTTTLFERNVRPQPLALIPLECDVDILWGCIYRTGRPMSKWAREIMTASRMAMQQSATKTHV